jgi:hypothetical protein
MFFIETVDHDLGAEFQPQPRKYSRPVRIAVILGLSAVLWGAIIITRLYQLFARIGYLRRASGWWVSTSLRRRSSRTCV